MRWDAPLGMIRRRVVRNSDEADMLKFPRTIRLDPSDTFIFERAAEPGEWAVSGAFMFSEADPAMLVGKARSAFRAGFLGIESLGWSTLVQIVNAAEQDRPAVVDGRGGKVVAHFGAPDLTAAGAAAQEGIGVGASLGNRRADTRIAGH